MRSWKVQARTVQAAVLRAPFLGEPERGHGRDPHLHLVPQGAVSHWDSFVLLESEVLDLLGWDPGERRSCLLSDPPECSGEGNLSAPRRPHCSTNQKRTSLFSPPSDLWQIHSWCCLCFAFVSLEDSAGAGLLFLALPRWCLRGQLPNKQPLTECERVSSPKALPEKCFK